MPQRAQLIAVKTSMFQAHIPHKPQKPGLWARVMGEESKFANIVVEFQVILTNPQQNGGNVEISLRHFQTTMEGNVVDNESALVRTIAKFLEACTWQIFWDESGKIVLQSKLEEWMQQLEKKVLEGPWLKRTRKVTEASDLMTWEECGPWNYTKLGHEL